MKLPTDYLKIDWRKIKSFLRLIVAKSAGLVLAVVFLVIAVFLLANPVVSILAVMKGQEAKITSVSDHLGKVKTACNKGGLFQVSARAGKEQFKGVYCVYPA